MPAIEFSRLRTKIELLAKVYDQPGQFVKDLSDLYFFYSDLTFQANNAHTKGNTRLAYRAPVVINRELESALKPLARSNPQASLPIIDALWATGIMEPCQLASALLGALPVENAEAVLDRIQTWSRLRDDPDLVNILHTKATETIRRENARLWLETLNNWFHSQDPALQKQSLLGLLPMINDPQMDNLPILFDFLEPILSNPDPHLVINLLTIVELLQARSETETVYFLKQIIRESKSEDLPRFIRRALPSFSEDAQMSLKTCLRENAN